MALCDTIPTAPVPPPCTITCPQAPQYTKITPQGSQYSVQAPQAIGAPQCGVQGLAQGLQLEVVTNVCPQIVDGFVRAITVEFTKIMLPPGTTIISTRCIPNPTSCCVPPIGPDPSPIEVDCSDFTVPSTLTATVTNRTGDCTCVPDSFTLTYNGFGQWGVVTLPNGCDTGGCLYLECVGSWSFSTDSCIVTPATLVSFTEDPFELIFDVTGVSPLCTGTFRITFTI